MIFWLFMTTSVHLESHPRASSGRTSTKPRTFHIHYPINARMDTILLSSIFYLTCVPVWLSHYVYTSSLRAGMLIILCLSCFDNIPMPMYVHTHAYTSGQAHTHTHNPIAISAFDQTLLPLSNVYPLPIRLSCFLHRTKCDDRLVK